MRGLERSLLVIRQFIEIVTEAVVELDNNIYVALGVDVRLVSVGALKEYLVQDRLGYPNRWASTLLRTKRPGLLTAGALASPAPKTSDSDLATRGFRMFHIHTCEISPPLSKSQTDKTADSGNLSTDKLYPSPIRDLEKRPKYQVSALRLHGTWRCHAGQRSEQSFCRAGEHPGGPSLHPT